MSTKTFSIIGLLVATPDESDPPPPTEHRVSRSFTGIITVKDGRIIHNQSKIQFLGDGTSTALSDGTYDEVTEEIRFTPDAWNTEAWTATKNGGYWHGLRTCPYIREQELRIMLTEIPDSFFVAPRNKP